MGGLFYCLPPPRVDLTYTHKHNIYTYKHIELAVNLVFKVEALIFTTTRSQEYNDMCFNVMCNLSPTQTDWVQQVRPVL